MTKLVGDRWGGERSLSICSADWLGTKSNHGQGALPAVRQLEPSRSLKVGRAVFATLHFSQGY